MPGGNRAARAEASGVGRVDPNWVMGALPMLPGSMFDLRIVIEAGPGRRLTPDPYIAEASKSSCAPRIMLAS